MGAALNDLAYAVNDTIKDPENFKPLNELIQDMITELKNTVNNVNTAVANVNTAVGTVNTNLAGGKVPVVRKIQRGTTSVSSDTTAITLSGFSNVNKMIVLLDGANSYLTSAAAQERDYGYAYAILPWVSALTASKLTLNIPVSKYGVSYTVSYQVIEFW